ncbi:MAG: hypothetical protein AAF415_14925 [Pseudomonadota bacterium]
MDPIKKVASFIGWLSGSLAGLMAVLYALGFIAMMAHQRLLGLDWAFVARDTLVFLGIGGQVAATFILLAPLILFGVLIVGESAGWALSSMSGWREGWRRIPGALARWLGRYGIWFLAVAASLLMIRATQGFQGALSITGLLFQSQVELANSEGVKTMLIDDTAAGARQARANEIVMYAVAALGVIWYAARILLRTAAPAIAVIIFAGVGVQALGALPIAYGIFSMRLELHPIQVSSDRDHLPSGLRLIEREGASLWLWNPATREVIWLAPNQIDSFDVGKPRPLFEKTP